MAILAVNAGSSSLKFSLHPLQGGQVQPSVLTGCIEGLEPAGAPEMVWSFAGQRQRQAITGQGDSPFQRALASLRSLLADLEGAPPIRAVAHRVVHGGQAFRESVLVTDAVLERLERLNSLAPLHQPHNLAGVRSFLQAFPALPQVACFDTAFHASLPDVASAFALPASLTEQGVRRYGFHGLSYEFMSLALAERHGDAARGRTIVAHLGSGASLCAMQGLQSVATTMGFSALDGLMMGTRCGALDPGAVLYLMEIEKLSLHDVGQLLYHGSGLLGLSGVSSDPRVLLAEEAGNARVQAALALYVRRIVREIGALVAVLGGLDMLVFTAGIGEHNAVLRQRVCNQLEWLGVQVDATRNARHEAVISSTASTVTVGVERTNEEWIAAWHAARLLGPAT